MKILRENESPIVIGKRVTLGAMINGVVLALSYFHPQHAQAIIALAIPLTFVAQIIVAHYLGITT